jgi:Mn-dependent DtxR family transcriptional regulator
MTPTQSRALSAIRDHQRLFSVSPSRRELARSLGVSLNASTEMVLRLARDGHIRLTDEGTIEGPPDGIPVAIQALKEIERAPGSAARRALAQRALAALGGA